MRLYINIDHVATLREARRTDEPDPVAAARLCEAAGADGITAHLREDRRHIQDRDVERLASSVRTVLNLELATSEGILDLACALRPFQATLVPERREEITTEGGLDLGNTRKLEPAIRRLADAGCRVSLFIDPDLRAIETASTLGVPAVELHTGRYAHSWREAGGSALHELRRAAARARELGLAVHAGHGLTYLNVGPVAAITEIEELNIGHSIVSRAIAEGLPAAVAAMRRLVDDARRS